MLLIPTHSQSSMSELLAFLDSSQSLRIFQRHELKYGHLDDSLINDLEEHDLTSLLTGLIDKQEQWQIYRDSELLVPEKSVQVSLSIPRLTIELNQGKRSLGQALCGYWQLEKFDIPPPTPVQKVLREEIKQLSVNSEQLSVNSKRSPLPTPHSPLPSPRPQVPPDPQWFHRWFTLLDQESRLRRKENKGEINCFGVLIKGEKVNETWNWQEGLLSQDKWQTLRSDSLKVRKSDLKKSGSSELEYFQ